MSNWVKVKNKLPAFFEVVHDEYRDDVTMTEAVFVYHRDMGVLPAIGFKVESGNSWWEYLGVEGKTMMGDNIVTHWMLMEIPRAPGDNNKSL